MKTKHPLPFWQYLEYHASGSIDIYATLGENRSREPAGFRTRRPVQTSPYLKGREHPKLPVARNIARGRDPAQPEALVNAVT